MTFIIGCFVQRIEKSRNGTAFARTSMRGCSLTLLERNDYKHNVTSAPHLEQFPVLLGTWSDQHGKRGHQEILEVVRLFPHTNTISVMTERMQQVKKPTAQPTHFKYKRTHFWELPSTSKPGLWMLSTASTSTASATQTTAKFDSEFLEIVVSHTHRRLWNTVNRLCQWKS